MKFHTIAVSIAAMSFCFASAVEKNPAEEEPFYVNGATINIATDANEDETESVTPVSEGVWGREYPDGYLVYNLQGIPINDSHWNLPGVTG